MIHHASCMPSTVTQITQHNNEVQTASYIIKFHVLLQSVKQEQEISQPLGTLIDYQWFPIENVR